MDKSRQINYKKYFFNFLRVLFVCLALGYVYKEVFYNQPVLKQLYSIQFPTEKWFLLLFVVVLMLVNWAVEAIKWKLLISTIEKIKFKKALKAVFSGVTASIFTPNRIGDFAGRIFFLKKADKVQATLITVLGNMAQLSITIVVGTLAFVFWQLDSSFENLFIEKYNTLLLIFLPVLGGAFLFYFLFIVRVHAFLDSLFNKKWTEYVLVFNQYKRKEILTILFYSLLRYSVFTFQFYLLLLFFGVEIKFTTGITLISLTFLATAAIPTFAFADIGVREAVAISFIGLVSTNKLAIVASGFSLWIINLAIPAIIGAIFLLSVNPKFLSKKK